MPAILTACLTDDTLQTGSAPPPPSVISFDKLGQLHLHPQWCHSENGVSPNAGLYGDILHGDTFNQLHLRFVNHTHKHTQLLFTGRHKDGLKNKNLKPL